MREVDRRLLSAMRDCGTDQRVAAAARGLSWCGEHGAVWIAAGLVGAGADRERRGAWLRGTALVGAAHLASMAVKLAVRRARPQLASLRPLVSTAGRHSFPSSHAASAAAAAVAFGALRPAGRHLVPPLAAAMCVSRLVVGVHYPTDVVAGVLLGGITAGLGAAWMTGPVIASTASTASRAAAIVSAAPPATAPVGVASRAAATEGGAAHA
ncbi:phosphatase PAP2 family protein [Streptomyces chryseus]|uniref:Membrane protein n=2 Tax=Streptomyces chryseus TaxID=68186 RepID=A0ABQ3DK75_9ACTN|nr:phosphatase PAP2 family protein [Streptomyces chryseus]GHB03633.1 membrane protein [Streptomyces chryseus]